MNTMHSVFMVQLKYEHNAQCFYGKNSNMNTMHSVFMVKLKYEHNVQCFHGKTQI